MARKKLKHEHFNEVPKFCTADLSDGSCVVYELRNEIRGMGAIEALFSPVKHVRYDGNDAVVEEPRGANSLFLEIRTGTILPTLYNEMELTWYEHSDDPSKEITLEEILVMCAI